MNLLASLAFKKNSTPIYNRTAAFFSSSMSSYGWERPFLTTNRFVLVQNPLAELPFIQLRGSASKRIPLVKGMTVRELEQQLKAVGEAKESASFIAPDGALIAKSTKMQQLL